MFAGDCGLLRFGALDEVCYICRCAEVAEMRHECGPKIVIDPVRDLATLAQASLEVVLTARGYGGEELVLRYRGALLKDVERHLRQWQGLGRIGLGDVKAPGPVYDVLVFHVTHFLPICALARAWRSARGGIVDSPPRLLLARLRRVLRGLTPAYAGPWHRVTQAPPLGIFSRGHAPNTSGRTSAAP